MKYKITIIINFLLITNVLFAQEIHYFNKQITYESSETYSVSGFELEDGFLIISYLLHFQGNASVLLSKLDKYGNLKWQKILDDVHSFPPINAVVRDKNNPNHFLISYFSNKLEENNQRNIALTKFTSNGDIIWKKHYGSNIFYVFAYHMIQTKDGGFLIGGFERDENPSMLAIKIDVDGVEEWSYTYPINDNVSFALSTKQTLDGGYLLSGRYFTSNEANLYLVKIDNKGEKEWQKVIDFYDDDGSPQTTQLSNGNYLVSGTMDYGWEAKHYTAILDSEGNTIREGLQEIPCLYAIFPDILTLEENQFIVSAMKCNLAIEGYVSPYLMSFNTNGDTLWTKQLVPSNIVADHVYAKDLKKTSDGGYLMTGHADFTFGDPEAVPYGWVVKMDNRGNTCFELGCDSTVLVSSIADIDRQAQIPIHISPNPASDQVNVAIPTDVLGAVDSNTKLEIRDVRGRLLKETRVETDSFEVIISDLAAGIYFVTLKGKKKVVAVEKLVVVK